MGGAILTAVGNTYETAREGGKHGGFYRRYREEGDRQIEKAIRSFQDLIREHEGWIADPFSKVPRTVDPAEVRRLVEDGWPDDIIRHREFIDILQGILQERRK